MKVEPVISLEEELIKLSKDSNYPNSYPNNNLTNIVIVNG